MVVNDRCGHVHRSCAGNVSQAVCCCRRAPHVCLDYRDLRGRSGMQIGRRVKLRWARTRIPWGHWAINLSPLFKAAKQVGQGPSAPPANAEEAKPSSLYRLSQPNQPNCKDLWRMQFDRSVRRRAGRPTVQDRLVRGRTGSGASGSRRIQVEGADPVGHRARRFSEAREVAPSLCPAFSAARDTTACEDSRWLTGR